MADPIVYRWDDIDAPVIRGEQESLIEVLTACLVDGYGIKSAAGWTKEFSNVGNTIACFRNNSVSGTGMFLHVDSTVGADNENYVQGYETMSSESIGLGPMTSTGLYFRTGHVIGTTPREWVLVADDRAFYLVAAYYAIALIDDSRVTSMFFGDGVAHFPSDSYFCMINAQTSLTATNGTFGYLRGPSTTQVTFTDGFGVSRDSSGTQGPYIIALIQGGGPTSNAHMGAFGMPYTPEGPVYLSIPHINDGTAYSFRGHLPGLYCPCHSYAFAMLETVTAGGKEFISLNHNVRESTTKANYLISLSDWRV